MPAGANWCQLVPAGANWCQLVPTGANWCQYAFSDLLQIGSKFGHEVIISKVPRLSTRLSHFDDDEYDDDDDGDDDGDDDDGFEGCPPG